jgi:signal transduction histidine kinase
MPNPAPGGTDHGYLGRSAKRVLIFSFAIVLALLVIAGWSAISTLAGIHTQEQAASEEFLSRAEPLLQIHSELTLYGDMVQTAPGEANQLASQIQRNLAHFPTARCQQEQTLITHLQALLTDQDRVRMEMLGFQDDATRMKSLLGTEVLPSHLRVIAATQQISFWNDNRFRTANAKLLASFNHLQDRLKILLFFLLGSGLAIAVGSVVLIAAQEKEIRGRYAELTKSSEDRAQLSARLMNAQEQERLAISRELHDEVGQSLGALLVDMGRLSASLPPHDELVQEQVRNIRMLAESSVAAVRNIALLLRPSMLDDLGLVSAVEWQSREISRRSDVEVEVQAEDIPIDLGEAVKICIYRVTQEALNNIARHSDARRAWVVLRTTPGRIELKIRDDGKGFDPRRSRGLGILGMEERVRLLHGSLVVNSTPGAGSEITAELPL